MNKLLPSLSFSIAAILLGAAGSYVMYLLEQYAIVRGYASFEDIIWHVINRLGWWYWGIPIAASVLGLYYAAKLDRPRTTWGFVSRIMMLVAFDLYIFSLGNTGLGLIASVLLIISAVMLIMQMAQVCSANRTRPDYSKEPLLVRIYASLTTEMDDRIAK